MNRRQKIIVSVTGIFIVLLVLLGLTYAYFLTRITGNGNPTSISVTTANLELVYGDGTTAILTSETPLMPSSTPIGTKDFTVTNNGDDSEYVVVFEDVTVKYAADTVIDGETVTAGTDTTFESNDFVYTLTCEVKDKNGNTLSDKNCDGVENETFPMDGGIVLGNSIDKNDVHSYVLTLYYLDNGLDQSVDMNKALNGKINIKDIKSINPYSENKQSLAYNIINNSMLNENGTELLSVPDTKVAEEVSWTKGTGKYGNVTATARYGFYGWDGLTYGATAEEANNSETEVTGDTDLAKCESVKNQYISDYFFVNYDGNLIGKVVDCESDGTPIIETEIMDYESSVSVTQDDLGTSYYYRGNVQDNYVNFAGMCWRIVRIAGDGSIKIILEDQYATCDDTEDTDEEGTADYEYTGNWVLGSGGNYGYEYKNVNSDSYDELIMNYLKPVTDPDSSMVKAFYDFQTTGKLKDYTDKLKAGDWCLGDKAYTRSGSSGSYTYTALNEYDYSSDMYYDSYVRLAGGNKDGYNPTLKCNGTIMNEFSDVSGVSSKVPMYVSAITADEIVYAGGKHRTQNTNYYLINDITYSFLSLSPAYAYYTNNSNNALVFDVSDGSLENNVLVLDGSNFRPAVSLKSGSIISDGEGTQMNPYVVE